MKKPIKVQYSVPSPYPQWFTIRETESASAAAYAVDLLFEFNQVLDGKYAFRALDENEPREVYSVRDNITNGKWTIEERQS